MERLTEVSAAAFYIGILNVLIPYVLHSGYAHFGDHYHRGVLVQLSEVPMAEVHQLFARRATYNPDRLRVLRTAFDDAWLHIAGNFDDEAAETVQSARTTLANIIISLPCSEIHDADHIKQTALQVMSARYRNASRA